MPKFDSLELLFTCFAFLFQLVLLVHFSLRKWRFDTAIRLGPVVYALSIIFVLVSFILILGGRQRSFWIGGFIYLAWAIFGYIVEYILKIDWRTPPVNGPVMGPYLILYLAANMFYWFPLALIYKPLWYVYAVLFVINTYLNITSHKVTRPMVD